MTEAMSAKLMAPYVSLANVADAPMHARALATRANAGSCGSARPVPTQIVHAAQFRAVLAAQMAPDECAVDSPEELTSRLRTPAWDKLVDCLAGDANADDQLWAGDLLFQLGFFRTYLDARTRWQRPEDSAWDAYFRILDLLAKHRLGHDSSDVRVALLDLATDKTVWSPARLLAAASVMVGAATGRPADTGLLKDAFNATAGTAHALESAHEERAVPLFLSTYWRAASFVPFLSGDTAETLRWLVRSLDFTERTPDDPDEVALAADMTRFPVLETRARVLRINGRHEEALAELRVLSALDPFDARVFLKLGATYTEMDRVAEAEACFLRAAALGPSLAPLAHLHLARHYRSHSDPRRGKEHAAAARRLDPTVAPSARPTRSAAQAKGRSRHLAELAAPAVVPDEHRAVQIQEVTMLQRERMLQHLVRHLGGPEASLDRQELESAVTQVHAIPEASRRCLLCGPSFSLWLAEAVRGTSNGIGTDGLATKLSALVTEAQVGSPASAGGQGAPAIGVHKTLFEGFVNRINEEHRAGGGLGDVVLSEDPGHISEVRQLLVLIERTWPELYREICEIIFSIQPFTSNVKTAITNASLHGALFICVPFNDDAVALDRFVHEAAHVLLNLALEVRPCHDGPIGASMPSPFRAGLRPIEGVLHGAYVFTRAAIAVARAEGALSSPMSAVRRIQRSLTLVTSALTLLDEFGNLNDYGQHVASSVRTSARELVSEFGLAQF